MLKYLTKNEFSPYLCMYVYVFCCFFISAGKLNLSLLNAVLERMMVFVFAFDIVSR